VRRLSPKEIVGFHGHGDLYSRLCLLIILRTKENPLECIPDDAIPIRTSSTFISDIRGRTFLRSTAPVANPAKSYSPKFLREKKNE
jgi:hypothetical protein